MNKGKSKQISRKIFSIAFIFLVASSALTLLMSCCSTPNIESSRFIGKSKQEVLEIIFQESPRTQSGELNIGIKNSKNYKYNNLYYRDISTALKDDELMDCNTWEVDRRKRFSISIFQKETSVLLYFEDDKVVRTEIQQWKKT